MLISNDAGDINEDANDKCCDKIFDNDMFKLTYLTSTAVTKLRSSS
jgi:hypothetical protein